ncbi:hypothetical protein QQ045_005505 [Rhodiola kirilowii]
MLPLLLTSFVVSICWLYILTRPVLICRSGMCKAFVLQGKRGLGGRTTMRLQMPKELAVNDGKTERISESGRHKDDAKKVKRRKLGADKEMMHAFFSSLDLNPSRLRSRKEMPASETQPSKKKGLKGPVMDMPDFKMVDLSGEDGPSIIGRRVEIYWPDSRRWFRGRVKAFDHQKLVHKIDYDDGDKEHLDMTKEVFRMEVYPGESRNIIPEYNIKTKLQRPLAQVASEQQKGHEAEKENDVESHSVCLDLLEKDSERASNGQQSVSVRRTAEVNNSCSSLTDTSQVEACPGMKDNMVEVRVGCQMKKISAKYNIIKSNNTTPDMILQSFEDEYQGILERNFKQGTPTFLGSIRSIERERNMSGLTPRKGSCFNAS